MSPITTYVFFDLEATGIPRDEHNRTRITELCMVAVKREHLLACKPGEMPRVQQKLNLCVNPRRLVHPEASKVSGLCNFLLENEPHFSEKLCSMLHNFLDLLTKPVCLVAQNGFNFDYPLLKNHLDKLNQEFPIDLLCLDSLYAFYDILESTNITEVVSKETIDDLTTSNVTNHQLEFRNDTEAISKDTAKDCTTSNDTNHHLEFRNVPEVISKDTTDDLIISNNTNHQDIPKTNMRLLNETTPKSQMIKRNNSSHSKVRRKLFWGKNAKPKRKYDLKDIYKRLLKSSPENCHHAEADCLLLLKCAVAVSEKFVKWTDDNHCLFSEVKPMRIGVPIGD